MEQINDSGVASFVAGDEVIQLRFGLPANRMILMRWADRPEVLTNLNEEEAAWLLFAGYTNACMAKGVEPLKTYEFFYEVVEENSLTDDGVRALTNIYEIYGRSKFTKKTIERIEGAAAEEEKKRSTGTPLSPSVTENSASGPESTMS